MSIVQGRTLEDSDYPKKPRRFLVVEADDAAAAELTAHLGKLGYRVVGTTSVAQAALAICRATRPDMVVIDVSMEAEPGVSLAQAIEEEMVVAVLGSLLDNELPNVLAGREAACRGVLMRPLSTERLAAGIAQVWRRFTQTAGRDAEIRTLERRLRDRKIVERAKWALVSSTGMAEPEAMRLLQKQARDGRRKLVDVAQSVLDTSRLCGEVMQKHAGGGVSRERPQNTHPIACR